MSTKHNFSIGETYDVIFSTYDYKPSDGWNFICTITDSSGTTITATSNYGTDGYDILTGRFIYVFTPDKTATMIAGNSVLNIRVEKDFIPIRAYKDTKYLVTKHNLQVLDPLNSNTDESYYIEMLRRVQETLKARAGDGVAEYNVADYGMKYIPIEKLIEMERYYKSKVDSISNNLSSVMQLRIL